MKKRNDKKNNFKEDFVNQARTLTKDWDIKVMSYVMLVIVMIAVIAATVAWFFYFNSAAVNNMSLTTASSDSLKIELKQGEKNNNPNYVELKEGEEDTVLAYLDMPVFDNVESYEITIGEDNEENQGEASGSTKKRVNKMAPGVYGSLTIRLTPLAEQINRYRISAKTIYDYIDSLPVVMEENVPAEGQTDPNVIMLQNLCKGHLLFFGDRVPRTLDGNGNATDTVTIDSGSHPVSEFTHNSKYVFVNPITEDTPLEGTLTWNESTNEGEPKEITIYWYWPYEYTNLSDAIKNSIALQPGESDVLANKTRLQYFDKDKLEEMNHGTGSYAEGELYDYADTRIGTFVEKIKLQLKVEGYHEMETQTQQTE